MEASVTVCYRLSVFKNGKWWPGIFGYSTCEGARLVGDSFPFPYKVEETDDK